MPDRYIRSQSSGALASAGGGSRWGKAEGSSLYTRGAGAGALVVPGLPTELLPRAITINGITETAFFRYVARRATDAGGWDADAGAHATEIGIGADPTYEQAGPGPSELSKYITTAYAGKCFRADDVPTAEITTEDFALEFFFDTGASFGALSTFLVEKRESTSTGTGWAVVLLTGGQLYCQLYPSGGPASAIQSAVLATSTRYHAIVFADRSGSGQWYVNGAASGAAGAISASAASMTSTLQARLLGRDGSGAQGHIGNSFLAQGWKRASGWFDTHLQAAVAAARYARVDPYY